MAITHFKDKKKLIILCDYCFQDITKTTRIQCIPCTFDMCVSCFYESKPIKNHLFSHPYKVIEPLSFSIFSPNWTSHEELLLIEGIFAFGLGNWKDVSDFLGTKSEKEVELHFYEISKFQNDFSQEVAQEKHRHKKIKIDNNIYDENKNNANNTIQNIAKTKENAIDKLENSKTIKNDQYKDQYNNNANQSHSIALTIDNKDINCDASSNSTCSNLPDMSNPNFHDISSFMPFRKDFDTEFENEYENLIKEINNDSLFDDDAMKELKDVLFDSYQNILKIRNQKKFVILEKKLYDYKNLNVEFDEAASEILKNIKCLAQFLSVSDFNLFFKGLCIENYLHNVNQKKCIVKEDYLSCEKMRHSLLSDLERKMCITLKISYKEYLRIKNKIIEEKVRYKYMDYKKMRSILGYNNTKSESLFRFFKVNKWI